MPQHQTGVLLDPTTSPLFLTLAVGLSDDDARTAMTAVVRLRELATALAAEHEAQLDCTIGLGSDFWDRLSKDERPQRLAPFETLEGTNGKAVATGGDLFVHIHSNRRDLAAELHLALIAALEGAAQVTEEVVGFRYMDSRDLTGFVDGTENPEAEERGEVALIDDEDPEFRGGSFALVQRYAHNLRYWSRLSTEEQEAAIGRTKADSEELPDDVRPSTSHISRVVIEEEGEELEIVRHSSPFASTDEQGLQFVAYCRTPETFHKMLARMFGTSGDGLTDRLMDFTEARSGALFFVPSVERLTALGG